MEKEISAGAIIYKIIDDNILYLIEFMNHGHISLTKGHLEKGESLEECAIREIKEETSLDVILDTSFLNKITYAPYKDNPLLLKDVYFFIAKVKNVNAIPIDKHDEEVNDLKFYNLKEAYDLLTYKSDKETLLKADKFIRRKENLNGF